MTATSECGAADTASRLATALPLPSTVCPCSPRVLVTGGAGFVGASVCLALRRQRPDAEVVALDSLKRRGSELNLPRLRDAGVQFVHGDVRERADLLGIEPLSAIVECSAEPSVLAGMGGGADYVVQTNLIGAHNCLELARRDGAQMIFLSTSRVYPLRPLGELRAARGRDALRARGRAARTRAPRRAGSRRTSRSRARARCTARRNFRPSCSLRNTARRSACRR